MTPCLCCSDVPSSSSNGALILPCEFCGFPVFDEDGHSCEGLIEAVITEMERRERDG